MPMEGVLMARVWFAEGCWWCLLSDGSTRSFAGAAAFIDACRTAVAEFEIPALDASWTEEDIALMGEAAAC